MKSLEYGRSGTRRPWMLQGPWYMDTCYKAQDYAEVAYFKQRRGIDDSKGLGLIRAIITE